MGVRGRQVEIKTVHMYTNMYTFVYTSHKHFRACDVPSPPPHPISPFLHRGLTHLPQHLKRSKTNTGRGGGETNNLTQLHLKKKYISN